MLLGLAIAGIYAVGAPALPSLFTTDAELTAEIEVQSGSSSVSKAKKVRQN